MTAVAIDKTKGSRKVFLCSNELGAKIHAWRIAQRPIPSESAAIAMLLWLALQAEREDEKKGRKK